MTDEAEVDGRVRRISNWGRWGEAAERGTLNNVGPEERVDAARSVTRDSVVSCAHPIIEPAAAGNG